MICDYCGKEDWLPFTCSYCGGKFCSEHRLPERHQCMNILKIKTSLWKKISHRETAHEVARRRILEKEREHEIKNRGYETKTPVSDEDIHHSTKPPLSKYLVILIVIFGIVGIIYITSFRDVTIEVTNIHVVYPEPFLSGDSFEVHVSMNKRVPTYLQKILNILYLREENITVMVDDIPILVDKINLGFNENMSRIYSILEKEPGIHSLRVGNFSIEFDVLTSDVARFEGWNIGLSDCWLGEDVNVSIDIRNVGGIVDTKTLFCYFDNRNIGNVSMELGPKQSTTIIFPFIANVSGDHIITFEMNQHPNITAEFEIKVVSFEVEIIEIIPNDPYVGQNVSILLKIVNVDDVRDTKQIFCYIDNQEIRRVNISLNSQQFIDIPFIIEDLTIGSHEISVTWCTEHIRSEITQTIYVSKPPIRQFITVDELIDFLDGDNVSDVVYASDFKCGDFAEALVERSHNAGYDINTYSMFGSELNDFKQYVESLEYVREITGGTITTTFVYGLGLGHAVCITEIGSDTYIIEPQNDMIHKMDGSGYEIVYFGEVTK